MQPLRATRDWPEAPMAREAAPRRDPAPSRTAYRLHRLWLTPLFHTLLRKGLPSFVLIFAAGLYLSSPENRAGLADWAESLRQSIAQRPEFQVQMMAIDGASPELSDRIRALVPLHFPVSSFEIDLKTMRRDISGLDAVATVDVRIRKGGVLSVEVTERRPVVVWRTATGIGTLDGEGHPVATLQARLERPDLPLIAGEGADKAVPEALAILAAAGPLGDRIRGLVRLGERRWDIVVEPDIRLMLPQIDPVEAVERIVEMDQSQHLLRRDISAVDLRIPERVTVRLKPDAVDQFRKSNVLVTGASHP